MSLVAAAGRRNLDADDLEVEEHACPPGLGRAGGNLGCGPADPRVTLNLSPGFSRPSDTSRSYGRRANRFKSAKASGSRVSASTGGK